VFFSHDFYFIRFCPPERLQIDNCLRLIDDEKWNEAREALQELSDLLGDNDIAVVKTQTALYFMED